MARILVVEDSPEMGSLIELLLTDEKHQPVRAGTLREARVLIAPGAPLFDLITLDVNLPDGKGFEFCSALRKQGVATPVIMLTTEVSAESVARGLECGADDYLKKPIDALELRARLRGHLRKAQPQQLLEFRALRMDLEKRTVAFEGTDFALSSRQFDILQIFLRRPEVVVTRESVIEKLGRDAEIYDRTIDSHVSQLRKKLKDAGVTGLVISPVYGVGYRLEASATA